MRFFKVSHMADWPYYAGFVFLAVLSFSPYLAYKGFAEEDNKSQPVTKFHDQPKNLSGDDKLVRPAGASDAS